MSSSSHPDPHVPRLANPRELMNAVTELRAMVPAESVNRMYDLITAIVDYSERDMRTQRDAVQARLNRVMDICDREQRGAMRWENPIPVPEWVAVVQRAALGDDKRSEGER